MCTVTFVALADGYRLGMNRDEQRTREPGRPPTLRRTQAGKILAPSESGDGTWIGVNDRGIGLALLNWYSAPGPKRKGAGVGSPKRISRGQVVRSTLSLERPAEVVEALRQMSLERVNPFRLLGVFPEMQSVMEWRWSGEHFSQVQHAWETAAWISSGLDELGAQKVRGKQFEMALKQRTVGSADWLRRWHRSHRPKCGPYSTCMHREDARTVSYTEIKVGVRRVEMRYVSGSPCEPDWGSREAMDRSAG